MGICPFYEFLNTNINILFLNFCCIYWGPQRMRILIVANPLKPKKFESAIFWGFGLTPQEKEQKKSIDKR
ncbi:MAG: hypothetical protein LBS83_03945 [Holosporales bacterium]|nr:hypothetical protein [Holosporales bacterium]